MSELAHYGTKRHSGRYPWGSGDSPFQSGADFLGRVKELRSNGLTEAKQAEALGMNTSQLRARISTANNELRKDNMATAIKLKAKGMSNMAIGRRMGINESSVRSLLDPQIRERTDILESTTNMLRDTLDKHPYIDVSTGVELYAGVSRTKMDVALAKLQDEGYSLKTIQIDQLGTSGNKTTIKVLGKPGTTGAEIQKNLDKLGTIDAYSDDGGKSFHDSRKFVQIDKSRVKPRYAEDGGVEKDGVIELRPGVADISLGQARYAQVRIGVDGTHYLKGMAMYGDPKDFPKGVDIIYNSNKHKGTPMLGEDGNSSVLKPMKSDPENPFGAMTRPRTYIDANGKQKISPLNVVNEEGDWASWSKNLPSQMLSKQSTDLAKRQLGIAYDKQAKDYDEISHLTNPVIKKKLLQSFSDGADSAAVHLKAAAMPGQMTHAILPITTMKETEVYAPNYKSGDKVVLIRFPHGGKFEIPELTVNNNQKDAKRLLGRAKDAVGINAKVAERLSGADFDGDNVLVIPNNNGSVKTAKALSGLKNFNPTESYPRDKSLPKVGLKTGFNKQQQMGSVSNLITDMTIKGATPEELARAVRHSMVIIDAEKHNLNYKQSAIDNQISLLKAKYQGGKNRGASTIISRATSETRVDEVKLRSAKYGGPIDPKTGKKVWVPTGQTYPKTNKNTGTTKMVPSKTAFSKMEWTDDARTLSSGTPIEHIYATHANKLKALANKARKEMVATPPLKYSPSAKKAYASEVASLKAKLNVALKNAPLERRAQTIANSKVRAIMKDNPDLEKDEIKKLKNVQLDNARQITGASKSKRNIPITPMEWNAIQAGAISNHLLSSIVDNTDLDVLKDLATPREHKAISTSMISRIKNLYRSGATQADIAQSLGVSVSAVRDALG